MKKITSLLCALTFVFYVSASPIHMPNPAKDSKKQLEQKLANAKTDKERLELVYKYKKSQLAQPVKKAPAFKLGKKNLPNALQESASVSINRYSTFVSMQEGKIFYGLHAEDESASFFFDIKLPAGKHDIELDKVYTLADMDESGSEWDDAEENIHYYKSATFKKTKGAGFDVHIEAVVVDADDNEFHLAYDETPVELTGTTINVDIERPLSSFSYIESDHTWLLRANNSTYFVDLRFFSENSESPVGQFNTEDVDLASTYIDIRTGELDEYDDPISVTVAARDAQIEVTNANGERLDIKFTIIGDDGNRYEGTMFYATPKAEQQEDFVAHDLNIDDWGLETWGEINVFANSDDGKYISLNLYVPDATAGFLGEYEFTESSSNNAFVTVEGEQFDIFSGLIKIEQDGDKYIITGKVLAWNNIEYNLNLSTPDPVVTKASFNGDNLVIDTYLSDGFFEIAGFDTDRTYYLLLTINSETVEGKFATDAVDAEYTYAVFDGNEYNFVESDLTVTYVDGIATVTGSLMFINSSDKYDYLQFDVNIKAGPYIPSERNVTIGEILFMHNPDQSISYGLRSEDHLQVFYFSIFAKDWSADVEFDHTYTLADMNGAYSYGENFDEREYVIYQAVSFTKTRTENGVQIIVTISDSRGNTWNLTYEGEDQNPEPIYVELGQASEVGWAGDGLQYEMIDVDNSFACFLIFPYAEGEPVEDVVFDSLYTSADGGINLEFSYLSIRKEEHKITDATFSKSVDGDVVLISARVVDDRGYIYELRYYDDGFHLTGDTIKIVINQSLEATDWGGGEWVLRVESENKIIQFSLYSDSPVGYFTDEIFVWSSHLEFLIDAEENNWSYVGLYSVEYVKVSQDGDEYSLEALVVGEDGNVYDITVKNDKSALINVSEQNNTIKRIENGVLTIERNGVRYDVNGKLIR